MGTLNYSLGAVFPVRKMSPLLLLNSHKRYTRLPSSLHDCIESPAPNTCYRPFIVLILFLPLIFYLYRINGMETMEYRMNADKRVVLALNKTHVIHQTKGRIDPADKTMELFDKDASLDSFQTPTNKTGDDLNNSSEVFEDATEDTGVYITRNATIGNKTVIFPHNGLPVCEINTAYTKACNVTINYNVRQEAAFLQNPLVGLGGYYKPSKCQTRERIAILVPYRHREENLAIFLTNIHQFLINQQIEYRIFIIEQSGTEKFNKGRVLNAGFDQIKDYWECFIFHDVDLLPLDPRILYTCPKYPRHMSTKVYEGGKIVKLTNFFGGVTAMRDRHFLDVNGYSNRFWGWGGEDNDMYWRIRMTKLPMMKYNQDIARYIMLPHVSEQKNPKRYHILNKYSRSRDGLIEDGLSTLKYTVAYKKLYPLFTHIVIDVNPLKDPVE